jgi:putative transposase
MARKLSFDEDCFYHIYSRGVDKRTIFEDEADRWWFMHLLYHCNNEDRFNHDIVDLKDDLLLPRSQTYIDLISYCLMPNHFHILLHERDGGKTSLFMHKLGTAYTKYFNAKYERTGSLFESTFRAKFVDDDEYLQHVFSYIALNPAKLADPKWKLRDAQVSSTLDFVREYPFSSTKEYLGVRKKYLPLLKRESFPFFGSKTENLDGILKWWLDTRQYN